MWELLSLTFVQIALLTSFVLVGIYTYLGFHVVSRGVIFVDLSLAQAAAFGSIAALAFGFNEHSAARYLISLVFTMLCAGIISVARTKDERVPQEAFIGIIYGGFIAGTILLLSHRPEGAAELSHILSGSLLTVQPNELVKITILCLAVGILHWIVRRRFFTISRDRQAAERMGWRIGLWDFLFYASFGFVVTSSVRIAGVMLVFALLVIPPVMAILFSQELKIRLILGWIIGFIAALLGVLMSLQFDFPVGPSIIAVLIGMLTLSVPILALLKQRRKIS